MRVPNSGSVWVAGLIFLVGVVGGEPYRPYPVVFVHGINSNARTWGFSFREEEIRDGKDIETLDDPERARWSTAGMFKGLMRPYRYGTGGGDTLWYMAALNFDDFDGSIDLPNQQEESR